MKKTHQARACAKQAEKPLSQAVRTCQAYHAAAMSMTDLKRLCEYLEKVDTPEASSELRSLQNSFGWLKQACDFLFRMHNMNYNFERDFAKELQQQEKQS